MIFYLIIALIPLLACYRYQSLSTLQKKGKVRDRMLFWAMFAVFLFIAIRGGMMGADTFGYWGDFVRFRGMGWKDAIGDTRMEAGFVIFTKLVGYITPLPQVYQLICTSIYLYCFYQFAKIFEDEIPFYFLFFFVVLGEYVFFFTGIRQCIAISLSLLLFRYVLERKLIPFLAIMALAFTIHHSVALFLIAYPIANFKVTWYNMMAYLVILYFASRDLEAAQVFINEQLQYEYEIEQTDNGGIFLALLLILTFFSYTGLYKSINARKYLSVLFNLNIVALFFWVIRLQTRVAERPSFYFLPFSCILFSYMLKNNRNSIIRLGLIIVPLAYYLYRFTTTFKIFVPYQSFFSGLI